MLLAFNKPYGVISQFSDDGSGKRTLAEFGFPKNIYSLGRLDADSEGLLLLSDEADLNAKLLHPEKQHSRVYWAQVEKIPDEKSLQQLVSGVKIQDYKTLPCEVKLFDLQPKIPPRDPPIRFRKNIPTTWIEIKLIEGKNRQVRRMTATIRHPTLRLIRVRIGNFELGNLASGKWKELSVEERKKLFSLLPAGKLPRPPQERRGSQ